MVAVIVGLLAGGPVGRFKLAASPRRRVVEAEAGHDPALPQRPGHRRDRRRPALAVLLVLQKGRDPPLEEAERRVRATLRQSKPPSPAPSPTIRRAAAAARAADQANARRVAAGQPAINERTANDYETRLADARARAERLRVQPPPPQPIPALAEQRHCPAYPLPPEAAAQAAGQDRLPAADALTATEQAIQLDELIKWVKAQAAIDPNEVQR